MMAQSFQLVFAHRPLHVAQRQGMGVLDKAAVEHLGTTILCKPNGWNSARLARRI